MGEGNQSLQATPIKPNVGSMSERGDGRVDEVPRTVLVKLTLLADTHTTVRDLLHNLGQFLGVAWLRPHQLPGAGLQCRSMSHKHDITTVGSDCL